MIWEEEFEINGMKDGKLLIKSHMLNQIINHWRRFQLYDRVELLLNLKSDILKIESPKPKSNQSEYNIICFIKDGEDLEFEIHRELMRLYTNPILLSKILEKLTEDYVLIYNICNSILEWEFSGNGDGNYESYFEDSFLDDPLTVGDYFIPYLENTKLGKYIGTPDFYAVMSLVGNDIVTCVENERY